MDQATSSDARRFDRAEPAHVVQVTAETEAAALALGEALNLSTGGACLARGQGHLGIESVATKPTYTAP